MTQKYLNLGCGLRFHHDWINIDFSSSDPNIVQHDLRKGIPFPDNTFDVVYHSHLLEHFSKEDAKNFCKECYRVLKQDGIIRIAVPDLEQIARIYLSELEKAIKGDPNSHCYRYEWMMLELYDQTVREKPGGEMLEYFRKNPIPDEDFVYNRVGAEADSIIQTLKAVFPQSQGDTNRIRNPVSSFRRLPGIVYRAVIRAILGRTNYRAFQIGLFRSHREVHKWMYDQYSLSQLLLLSGFRDPNRVTASMSFIWNWGKFNLDTDIEGTIYKPDSLYMEAFKLKNSAKQ
jgi:predicted SAM-dependent methyltransferase